MFAPGIRLEEQNEKAKKFLILNGIGETHSRYNRSVLF